MIQFENSKEFARKMDEQDLLKSFRKKFLFPKHKDKDCIYLCGNSLGLQPVNTKKYLLEELEDWSSYGVEGHFKSRRPWVSFHEQFSEPLSILAGCKKEEVVSMNQLTVNLHLLLVSFYKPKGKRFKILCESKAFPSDQYVIKSQLIFHGHDPESGLIEIEPRPGKYKIETDDIIKKIEEHRDEIALVLMGGVNYYSGQVFNIKDITRAAHAAGAMAGFDLAHAIGNTSLKLHEWNVDFAAWCSYKYLNSGPGGVAGIFIHERHCHKNTFRFSGWWGHNKERRFLMEKDFDPIPTAEGWQLSNAPVLSMAAHKAALEIFLEAGMENIFRKRDQLTGFLEFIIEELNSLKGKLSLEIITPQGPERGSQLSIIAHGRGKELHNYLTSHGVISDWREPNVVRFAPVPLYNSFEDIFELGMILKGSY